MNENKTLHKYRSINQNNLRLAGVNRNVSNLKFATKLKISIH